MTHEQFCEQIADARPHPQVAAALDDDPVNAGILTEVNQTPLIGSRLFNVVTASMDVHRADPIDGEPVERVVEVPDDADRLIRFAGRILNDKLILADDRRRAPISFHSGPMIPARTDSVAEAWFADCAGLFDEPAVGRIYAQPDGTPILFETDFGRPGGALSFKPLRLNSVDYPGGTLFSIKPDTGAPRIWLKGLEIIPVVPSNVTHLAPGRLTRYAFPPLERFAALTPIPGFESQPSTYLEQQAQGLMLSDISDALPSKKELHNVLSQLNR